MSKWTTEQFLPAPIKEVDNNEFELRFEENWYSPGDIILQARRSGNTNRQAAQAREYMMYTGEGGMRMFESAMDRELAGRYANVESQGNGNYINPEGIGSIRTAGEGLLAQIETTPYQYDDLNQENLDSWMNTIMQTT